MARTKPTKVKPIALRRLLTAVHKEVMIHLTNASDNVKDELQHKKKDYSKPDDNSFVLGGLDDEADVLLRAKEISNKEIENLVESVTISEDEANRIVEKIMTDLNSALKDSGFTGNEFRVYGSYDTGLCSIDSDIDLYYENIKYGPGYTPIFNIPNFPSIIVWVLKRRIEFSEVQYFQKARVPIIKLKHKGDVKQCDISFCESGIKSSLLTKFYLKLNPNVKFLTMYLKLVLQKCNIYGTNCLTSHVIFWLVVFFLQQKNLLPPVKSVRKKYSDCEENDLFENWNCSLTNEKIHHSYNSESNCSISTLLFGFAKFYKDFDFTKNVISPYLACAIPIDEFDKWEIPGEIFPSELLRNNNDGKNTFYRHVMNIQEPTILSSNLTKNVQCKVLNSFVTVCHELLSNRTFLPLKDLINLNSSPCRLPTEESLPEDLKRFASRTYRLGKKYFKKTNSDEKLAEMLSLHIHRVMDGALHFQLQTIAVEQLIQVEFNYTLTKKYHDVTVPVIYMDYLSTEKTWSNENVSKVLSFQSPPDKRSDRLVKVHLICEIYRLEREVRILIETDKNLLEFLRKYGPCMFRP
ncbi:poly(A) RNA polymerase, mitochondrial-like [Planococcus citri]|uniref:poly(A) RNA polymerase, mitochondrial-like n=1 Tax=Planococcus citri TaxID=170843 RepID=UPI0031F89421